MSEQTRWGVVVLAAGKGTRMQSATAKVLHRLAGRALVDHVLDVALEVAPREHIAVVVGHQADAVRTHLTPSGVVTPVQEPQLGTGHALQVGLAALDPTLDAVLVLSGDAPLLRPATVNGLCSTLATGASAVVVTALLDQPGQYGRIVRASDGSVERIVEAGDADPEALALREVNAGVYAFLLPPLCSALSEIAPDNAQGEYYLTDVIEQLRRAPREVRALQLEDPSEMLGVNSRHDLARAARALNDRHLTVLMDHGVTVVDPATTWIDPDCGVGQDTVIEPGVVIRGRARIGRRCSVGASSVIDGAIIDDDTAIPPLSNVLG